MTNSFAKNINALLSITIFSPRLKTIVQRQETFTASDKTDHFEQTLMVDLMEQT